jgi:ribosomal-protein-alanine N-acetyltransferase
VSKITTKVDIRWFIRRDMPEVLRIEHDSFEHAWTEEDFISVLRNRNCIGMVAEECNRIVGSMVYELSRTRLHVLNFAVAPAFRRQHVGAQMIEKLVDKLSRQRRQEIVLEVRDSNLSAQQFFANQGFRAVSIIRGHYVDTDEDAYVMLYSLAEAAQWQGVAQTNRIANY